MYIFTFSMIETTKAKPRLFKLRKDLDKYLHEEAQRSGKTMVRIMEELLEFRRRFKHFPPRS